MAEETKGKAKMSRVQAFKAFFFREGVDTNISFLQEVRALDAKDRDEMAVLIAAEMGIEIIEQPNA